MSRSTHLLLRRIAVLIVEIILVAGSAVWATFTGASLMILLEASAWTVGQAQALAALVGVTVLMAGVAGMDHLLARMRAFLDPGPEDEEFT